MKKFFNVCKKVAVFGAGAFTAVGLERGFYVEVIFGIVLAVAVYVLATVAEQRVPTEKEQGEE